MGADDYMLKSLNTGPIDKADKQGTKTNTHKSELKRVSDPSSCYPKNTFPFFLSIITLMLVSSRWQAFQLI